MVNKLNSERDIGWLSGIIDGEGHLGLYRNRQKRYGNGFAWSVRIGIANTNLDALRFIKSMLGVGFINRKSMPARSSKYKQGYAYIIDSASSVLRILPQLSLRIKASQSALLLEAASIIVAGRNNIGTRRLDEIHDAMRKLNQRGPTRDSRGRFAPAGARTESKNQPERESALRRREEAKSSLPLGLP